MIVFEPQTLWLGSLDTYLATLEKVDRVQTRQLEQAFLPGLDDDEKADEAPLYVMAGDTAVIEIFGTLIPHGNLFTRLFGLTSYDDVRERIVAAVNDTEVKSILLNIDSPGGAVTGVKEAVDLVRKAGKAKSIAAYTSGLMTSAAYWLGSAADLVLASELSTVGSIGVIAVHQEYTKMLENDGVKATILRQGRYKALGHPLEELSPEARAVIQGKMQSIYDIFVRDVAAARGLPAEQMASTAAEGREFWGFEGRAVGLVDQVLAFDEALHLLQTSDGAKYTARRSFSQPREATVMSKDLTLVPEQALAALASGGDPAALAGALADAGPEAGTGAEPAPTPAPAQVVEPPAAGASAGEGASIPDQRVELLRADLKETRAELMAAQLAQHDLQSRLEKSQASVEGLRSIAATAINRLQVALGMPAMSTERLEVTAVLELYSGLNAEFQKRFKVGAQAQVPVEGPRGAAPGPEPMTRAQRARLEAVK